MATPAQIQAWMRGNPNATDAQIFAAMRQNNVTPAELASAMGYDLATVQQRYNQAQAENTPTGLVGYEQAAERGLADATGTLRNSLADINRLYGINIDDLQAAAQSARGDITRGYGEARDYFRPFQEGGQRAFQQQLALSGALGKDAFNAARVQSPYEQFLFEQGMRSNLAGAAATGGLGGGNVQKELQRFGQGLASQGLQQQIGNLNTLSGYGMQGSQAMGNLATGEAGALAEIGLNTAQNIAGQRGQQAGYVSNVGTNIAQMQQNTAQNIAANRARIAELIAQQQEAAALQQASLLESQGLNLQTSIGQQGENVVNIGQSAYDQYVQDLIQQAQAQADLALSQGQQQANILGRQGFAQTPAFDYAGAVANALEGAGTGFYLGERMKTTTGNTMPPYFSGTNPSPSYGQRGRISTGIPGMPSINVLSGANLKRLAGGQ